MYKVTRKHLALLLSGIATLSLVGCQTVPYDSHKKIETQGNFYTRQLTQDAKLVNRFEVMNSLKLKPETEELAKKSQYWYYAAMGLSGVGGFLIGYNLVQSNGSGGVLLGALAIAGGAGAASMSDAPLLEALQIHNSGAIRKKRGALDFHWNFNLARAGAEDKQQTIPYFGVHSEF